MDIKLISTPPMGMLLEVCERWPPPPAAASADAPAPAARLTAQMVYSAVAELIRTSKLPVQVRTPDSNTHILEFAYPREQRSVFQVPCYAKGQAQYDMLMREAREFLERENGTITLQLLPADKSLAFMLAECKRRGAVNETITATCDLIIEPPPMHRATALDVQGILSTIERERFVLQLHPPASGATAYAIDMVDTPASLQKQLGADPADLVVRMRFRASARRIINLIDLFEAAMQQHFQCRVTGQEPFRNVLSSGPPPGAKRHYIASRLKYSDRVVPWLRKMHLANALHFDMDEVLALYPIESSTTEEALGAATTLASMCSTTPLTVLSDADSEALQRYGGRISESAELIRHIMSMQEEVSKLMRAFPALGHVNPQAREQLAAMDVPALRALYGRFKAMSDSLPRSISPLPGARPASPGKRPRHGPLLGPASGFRSAFQPL